jgi:hypothetical protein
MKPVDSRLCRIVFVIIGGIATASMVNAPAIFLGYGFIYVVMLLAAWLFRPRDAFLTVLGATVLALPFLIIPKSAFTEVAILNIILRPLITYPTSVIRWRNGLLASTLSLTALETFTALTVATLYYGNDGIHTGLTVFGIMLSPFAYVIYRSIDTNRIIGILAGSFSLCGYYFSLYAFPALFTLLLSVIALFLLLFWIEKSKSSVIPAIAIILIAAGFISGGIALQSNLKTSLYPFNPESWGDDRWTQKSENCPLSHNVFEHTHTPSRLRIVNTCVEVVGVVSIPPFVPEDGDYCFDILPQETFTLGIGNYLLRKGGLHIEVVPADQDRVLTPIGGGVCPGDLVRVKGVWVVDTDHGMWAEIHPALEIEVLKPAEKRWPECIVGLEPED